MLARKRKSAAKGNQLGISITDLGMLAKTVLPQMSGWPTPKAEDAESTGFSAKRLAEGKIPDNLHSATKMLAPWGTPKSSDHRPGHASRMLDTARINLNDQAMLAGWSTPAATDGKRGGQMTEAMTGQSLTQQARLAPWATPATRDYRTPNHETYADRSGTTKGEQLNNQVAHVIPGASLNGLDVSTGGGGLLNPEFSRWLQGIPATWPSCAPTATRSIPSQRLK